MKLAFVTTQTLEGSTVVGRVLPLVQELQPQHEVHLLVHESQGAAYPRDIHIIGRDPFERTEAGKKRLGGMRLVARIALNALRTFFTLLKLRPDVIIVVKSLPQNVFAVWLAQGFNRKSKIILDVDDFELTANKLSSLMQRSAVHWAERTASRMAHTIVAASPFLQDHFEQLAGGKKKVVLIPTGISYSSSSIQSTSKSALMYVGSVSISSGHRVDLLPDILEAVRKEIPDVTLTIAGSGDDVARLQEMFRTKGLERAVTWTGRFTVQDIPELIAAGPILIDPVDAAIANRAKSSFRVALAVAAGLPIVTSNVGIRAYLVPDQFHSRFFAAPENPQSYAERILALVSRPLTEEEQRLLHKHALQYTWDSSGKTYAGIISA